MIWTAWSATGPAVTEIDPADESTVIPSKKVFPDPDIVMLPVARTLPVGVILVPPLIEIVPAEVSAPAPEYPAVGVIVMFAELVVVCAAVTETVGLEIDKLPAALVVADTVAVPVVLEIATVPVAVIGAPLVIPVEEVSRTVPALIAPVPVVLTVDTALEIATSCAAVMVDVVALV